MTPTVTFPFKLTPDQFILLRDLLNDALQHPERSFGCAWPELIRRQVLAELVDQHAQAWLQRENILPPPTKGC